MIDRRVKKKNRNLLKVLKSQKQHTSDEGYKLALLVKGEKLKRSGSIGR